MWPPATVIDLCSAGEEGPDDFQWADGVTVHHVPLLPEAAVVGSAREAGPHGASAADLARWRQRLAGE